MYFSLVAESRSEQELEVQIAFPQQILNIPQPGWQQNGNQSQCSDGGGGGGG